MGNFIMGMLNYVLGEFGVIALAVIALLPESPFQGPGVVPGSVDLGGIAYFIPFVTMIQHFGYLVSAIAIYYVLRVILRWVKVSRS